MSPGLGGSPQLRMPQGCNQGAIRLWVSLPSSFWLLVEFSYRTEILVFLWAVDFGGYPRVLALGSFHSMLRYARVLSWVQLFATPWTVAHKSPLSMGFFRQEYWGRLPLPPPGDIPDPGIKHLSLNSPALAGGFFTTSATWEDLSWYEVLFTLAGESYSSLLPGSFKIIYPWSVMYSWERLSHILIYML